MLYFVEVLLCDSHLQQQQQPQLCLSARVNFCFFFLFRSVFFPDKWHISEACTKCDMLSGDINGRYANESGI